MTVASDLDSFALTPLALEGAASSSELRVPPTSAKGMKVKAHSRGGQRGKKRQSSPAQSLDDAPCDAERGAPPFESLPSVAAETPKDEEEQPEARDVLTPAPQAGSSP